jgi:hypothetical protein
MFSLGKSWRLGGATQEGKLQGPAVYQKYIFVENVTLSPFLTRYWSSSLFISKKNEMKV